MTGGSNGMTGASGGKLPGMAEGMNWQGLIVSYKFFDAGMVPKILSNKGNQGTC